MKIRSNIVECARNANERRDLESTTNLRIKFGIEEVVVGIEVAEWRA